MRLHVGIAGAGLAGRLAALGCRQRGWDVSLFDSDNRLGYHSCGWVAAGMIAPYTELESSEPLIAKLGLDSLTLWPTILKQMIKPIAFQQEGTLLVAHPQDLGELQRLLSTMTYKLRSNHLFPKEHRLQPLTGHELNEFVPGLSPMLQTGYWIADEAHINSHDFYQASTTTLLAEGVHWHEHCRVEQVAPHQIQTKHETHQFDLVIDCRGLGAKKDWPKLRGVRGEIIYLQSKEIRFKCPVRIAHPRYPIYISPRNNHIFVVGATAIESEDLSPISTQSMLELLSACYTVHPAFSEARIMQTFTQCRPTFPHHHPKISVRHGLIRINGLYRHGYLVGPAIINIALQCWEYGTNAVLYPELIDDHEEEFLCKS